MERGRCLNLMVVVENDHERRSQQAEQILEVAPGEEQDIIPVFGGKTGEGMGELRRGLLSGQPHVVKKGGAIGIPLIDLVPDVRQIAGFEVMCRKGRFARAGRGLYPDNRFLQRRIHALYQPGAWIDAGDDRGSYFVDCRFA